MSENVDTICVQGGYQPGNGESRTPPIIQATTFKYKSSEQMSRLFDLTWNPDTSTLDCRIQPTTPSQRKSVKWKAARPQC